MATRRERVILDLEDRFSTKMARAATATALMARELDGLDSSSRVSGRAMDSTSLSADRLATRSRRAGTDINQLTGRLALMAQVGASLGPGLIPIGAVGIPAVTGLASALGFAALAGGTAIAAFQGVGDALEAVNKAALEPTEANLAAARQAMQDLSPAARDLVGQLREFIPALKEMRDTAAEGMFPGLIEGLDGLERALPRVERILEEVSTELGDIAADAGESLGGERWAPFLEFLADEAPSALSDLATATGNVTHTMAELWMAFDPLNDDFSRWMVNATDRLDDWATGLDQTEGFQDFVDYVRQNGPQVAETLGAVATALVDILQAAAPLGGPALQAVEGIAKAVSAVADSEMGTPIATAIAGVSALNILLGTTRRIAGLAMAPLGAAGVLGATGGGRGGRGAGRGGIPAVVPLGGGDRDSARGRQPSRSPGGRHLAPSRGRGGGPGLESVAWVIGAVAGLDYLDTKLAEIGESGTEAQRILRDFDVPKTDLLDKVLFGDSKHTLEADLDRVLNAKKFNGFFAGIEEDLGRAIGGSTFTKSIDNVEQLDTALARVSQRNPAKALDIMDTVMRKTGVSAYDLNRALPKTAAAFRNTEKSASGVGSLLGQSVIPNFAAYQQILLGMPGEVVTRVAAEGTDLSRADVRGLQLEYELTPRQVRTLMSLTGDDDLRSALRRARGELRETNGAKAEPSVSLKGGQRVMLDIFGIQRLLGQGIPEELVTQIATNGVPKARSAIVDLTRQYNLTPGQVDTLIRESGGNPTKKMVENIIARAQDLGRQRPTPRLSAQDNASPIIRRVGTELGSLDGRTATTYVRTVRSGSVTGARAVADGGQVAARFPGETTGARDDTIPAMLSHREYVQPVAAVDWYGERLMEDIRTRRFPRPEGYADGGLVENPFDAAPRFARGGPVRRPQDRDRIPGRNRDNDRGRDRDRDDDDRRGRKKDRDEREKGTKAQQRFRQRLEESRKSLEREKAQRDELIQRRDTLAGTVRDSFRSELFGEVGNVWGAGGAAGNPLATLRADIAKASAFNAQVARLRKAGVSGDALAEISATGDSAKAQALLGLGAGGVRQYQSLYDQRARISAAVGGAAGNAAYGAQVVREQRDVAEIAAAVKRMEKQAKKRDKDGPKRDKKRAEDTGKATAKGVNGGAARGQRNKRAGSYRR